MKKILSIIFRYLLLALAAVLVGVNLQAVIASKLAGNEVPMPFGIGISVVMSGSMEPELKVGDLIVIREYEDGRSPEAGDVVVYISGDTAVVHRVIETDGATITTQGDANNAPDEPFDVSAVKGRVVLYVRYVGYLVLFLKTPLGIVATLGLAILVLELSYRKKKRKKEEKLEALKAEIRELMEEVTKE